MARHHQRAHDVAKSRRIIRAIDAMTVSKKAGPKGSVPARGARKAPAVVDEHARTLTPAEARVLNARFAEAAATRGIDLAVLDGFLNNGDWLPQDQWHAILDRERAADAFRRGNTSHALEILRVLVMVMQTMEQLVPKAKVGQSFKAGRKPGTVGPIRKAIAKLLKSRPTMKTADVWETLAKRPPPGWTFYDTADSENMRRARHRVTRWPLPDSATSAP